MTSSGFNISITGNSNDSDLVLGSSSGSITETTSANLTTLESKTATLETKTATLETKTATLETSMNNIESLVIKPETKTKNLVGELQTWKYPGANLENSNYLPETLSLNPHSLQTLKNFSMEPIPENTVGRVSGQRFKGLIDETHYYEIVNNKNTPGDGFWSIVGYFKGVSILKFDRFTGSLVGYKNIEIPSQAYDQCGNLVDISNESDLESRGPLAMDDNNLFIQDGTSNLVLKYRKSDLNLVWAMAMPYWRPTALQSIITVSGELLEIPYNLYHINAINPLPNNSFTNNKNHVIVTTSSTISYGGGDSNAIARFNTHDGGAYIFCIEDNGNSCKLAWEFSTIPENLTAGIKIPDECFTSDSSSVHIWEKLKPGTIFTDGSNVTGTPRNTFPIRVVAEYSDEISMNGIYYRGTIPTKMGILQFSESDSSFNLDASYTITDIFDLSTGLVSDVSNREVIGRFVSYLPMVKCLYKDTGLSTYTHTLSQDEADGLNYYGCTMYGTNCYDVSSGIFFTGTSNGYACPLEDQMIIQSYNDTSYVNLDGSNINYRESVGILDKLRLIQSDLNGIPTSSNTVTWKDDIIREYIKLKDEAAKLWNNGLSMYGENSAAYSTTSAATRAFELSKLADKIFFDNESKGPQVRRLLSPRAQRFLYDSTIGIRASDGKLVFANCPMLSDLRDNVVILGVTNQRNLVQYYTEAGLNNDIGSCLLTNYTKDGIHNKKLVSQHKFGLNVFDLSGINSSGSYYTSSISGDINANHGLVNMTPPQNYLIKTEWSGTMDFAAVAIHEDNVYYRQSVRMGLYGNPNLEMCLAKLPVNANPIVSHNYTTFPMLFAINLENDASGNTNYLWTRKLETGIAGRLDELSSTHAWLGECNGGLAGYGELLLSGSDYGGIDLIDKNNGRLVKKIDTINSTYASVPIVNYTFYNVGTMHSYPAPRYHFSNTMEMFTLHGK